MTLQLQLAMNAAEALDVRVADVLGRADLDERTAELLRLLAGHKGAAHAISIHDVMMTLNIVKGDWDRDHFNSFVWNDRAVKAAVKDLIERFAMPIGGSRRPPYGYFLILTAEDQRKAVRPLVNELKSLSRRVRSLSSKRELARLWGQVQLELDREDPQTNAEERPPADRRAGRSGEAA